jgi:TonB-linked SusC/RagA family outer membrane protein
MKKHKTKTKIKDINMLKNQLNTWPKMVLITLTLFGTNLLYAQQEQVKGATQDENGQLLSGVSIKALHTTTGNTFSTSSSNNGLFTFSNLPEGGPYQFIFSSVGYQNDTLSGYTIRNGQQIALSVRLKISNQNIDEVYIGYGVTSKKDLTGSITSIKSEDLNTGVFSNVGQLLQGKVPGLVISNNNSNPNATPSVTLRGSSSLRSGEATEPYYVIDGVPGASLALVSPQDIESIDVLRDASATAIYGSKAANGVIIVTTKKGKTGQSAINYDSYLAVDKIAKRLEMMNAQQYRSYINDNGFSMEPVDDTGADTDWQKEVSRVGISHNHNISILGGNEKTKYSASINTFNNQGVINGTDLGRQIGRGYVQSKAMNDKLDVSFNVNVSLTKQNNVPALGQGLSVFDAMYYYLPYSPLKNDDGTWFENTPRSQYANPVSLIEENIILSKTKLIQGHAKLGYQIFDGLKYNLDLSLQNKQYNFNEYNSSLSMIARNMNGRATRAAVEDQRKVLETNLSYDKTFNTHKISALIGYSWEQADNNDGIQLSVSDFYGDDLTYYNPGMANVINRNGFGGYYLSTLRMISLYSRLNYTFDNKYILQGTLRRDGSSAFGLNNRWGTFPSISAAWKISEEAFLKNSNVINELKLRTGYGSSGNSLGFDVFTARSVYGASVTDFENSLGQIVRTLKALRDSNPNLKWERTDMLNVGVDFSLFNNRISGSVEWYDKNTSDLIYSFAVSPVIYPSGYLTANIGKINNRGIEFSVNTIPAKTEFFTWNSGINLSQNKNIVKSISNERFSSQFIELAYLDGAGHSNANQQRLMEGYAIGQFYTWEWAGYNEDGVSTFYVRDEDMGERTGETTITPELKDRAFTGTALPKFTLGWNNSFAYRQWSATMLFQGVFGGKIMNGTRARHSNVVGNAGNKNILTEVVNTQKPTDINAHYLSDRYLESGDYLRISTLSLGYTIKNLGSQIKNIRLAATINNPYVFTKYKGLDPEVNLGGLEPGIDNRQTYPRTRTFMFGANFNF